MSGNVLVSRDDTGAVIVRGDEAANNLIFVRAINSMMHIFSQDDTLINGQASFQIRRPATKLDIRTSGGDDLIGIADLRKYDISIGIVGGAGDDIINVGQATIRAMDVFGGSGNDRISMVDSTASHVRLMGEGGHDVTGIRGSFLGASLEIIDGGGSARIGINSSRMLTIHTGDSDDTISFGIGASSTSPTNEIHTTRVYTRGGDDSVRVRDTVFASKPRFILGSENDVLDLK